jgi:hypothetical protein
MSFITKGRPVRQGDHLEGADAGSADVPVRTEHIGLESRNSAALSALANADEDVRGPREKCCSMRIRS